MADYVKPTKTGSNDETVRDAKGKWQKGTPSPNPTGRPRRVVEAETLAALSEVWTKDEIKKVAAVLLSYAQAGNIGAAITILKYTAGNPPENLNIKSAGGDDLSELTDDQIMALLAEHGLNTDEPDAA